MTMFAMLVAGLAVTFVGCILVVMLVTDIARALTRDRETLPRARLLTRS